MRAVILLLLCLLTAFACAQEDSDWIAYRDAYRQMIWFEKYGKPKQFLQNHYRLRPRDKSISMDGVRLTLNSKAAQVSLALDALGRAVFPFSKAAYDDNAELVVNRKASQFKAGPWVSIVTRPDGVYTAADLRTACEQQLAYLRYSGVNAGKGCVGVQFTYGRSDTAQVQFHATGAAPVTLAVKDGPAFADDVVQNLRVVVYRFASLPEAGQLVTGSTPLAIAGLFE
ncbi:hypothetical protein SAMN05192549_115125 [Duganella sacchari]|uniref:Uncharacterized protein n=1 Tax=Duganella sacchari TaxID=551987 RepID=A0A1M7RA96_9BURK|nr:hypothetical protein [Duganella sacchari]SHN42968.1 hypothetical protein SAMN05192549_115125 [Duganella sacchari]